MQLAIVVLPRPQPGHYGVLHSVEIERILGPDQILVGGLWLLDARAMKRERDAELQRVRRAERRNRRAADQIMAARYRARDAAAQIQRTAARRRVPMIDDCWETLIALKTELRMWPDRAESLAALPDEQAVIEVYLDDIEQDMFILAANRMADLLGIETLRVNIEDGMPSSFLHEKPVEDVALVRALRIMTDRGSHHIDTLDRRRNDPGRPPGPRT